jgi:uncharacterized membrane protein YbhN (UPF0104 family)
METLAGLSVRQRHHDFLGGLGGSGCVLGKGGGKFRAIALKLVWGGLSYLLSNGARAQRWDTILAHQGVKSAFGILLAALFIGFGSNSILPAYFGPILRTGILNRREGIPIELALGSIFAERMLDLGVVLLFLVLPLSLRAVPSLSSLNASLVLLSKH